MKITIETEDRECTAKGGELTSLLEFILREMELIEETDQVRIVSKNQQYVLDKMG